MANRMMKWFKRPIPNPSIGGDMDVTVNTLAQRIDEEFDECAEKTVALRHLLDCRDALVRARIEMSEKESE